MTMEFVLASSEYDGMTAELYNAALFLPFPIPIAAGTVTNGSISFNVPPFNDFALRIQDGSTYLRSGIQDLDIGTVDNNGDFSVTYLVMRITDPNDTVISTNTFEDEISLPLTQDGLTVNTLSLSTPGGNLRATGTADFDTGVVGSIAVNYTYDFSLEPVNGALSSRLINVETVSSSVTGAAGGLFGWIINLVVNILALLFHGTIADKIEDAVQEQVDDAVEAQFAAAGAPDEAMATLQTATISGGDVTIDPFILIPLSAISCPFSISSGSIKVRDRKQLRKLRAMRDRVLKETPQGNAYIQLLQQHAPELVSLLATNPRLLKRADELIKRGLEEFDEEAPGKGVLSKESGRAAKELLQSLAKNERTSPHLRQTIERTLPEVDEFVGRPVRTVLDDNSAKLKKLRG